MFKKQMILSSLFMASMALSNAVSATPIVNGTFDTDLSGWSTLDSTNDLFANGTVHQTAGQAVLSTGDGSAPLSAAIDQGLSFAAISLGSNDAFFKFEALITRFDVDTTESLTISGDDSLNVWMYDINDPLNNYFIANIANFAVLTATEYSFDLSPYSIGLNVAFSFELADEDDGFNSKVALDNIRIEQRSVTVPEPGTFMLVILGWFGLTRTLLYINRKAQYQIS